MQGQEQFVGIGSDGFVVQRKGGAFGGVDAAQAFEELGSGHVAGEAEAGAVGQVAVGVEEDAAVEIPNDGLAEFVIFFGIFLGFDFAVGAVFDAGLWADGDERVAKSTLVVEAVPSV
jgi:hypothetical protein